ncbi:hypothetical protein, partial [Bacillus sp. 7884-1]|uniref:hypothetical protein n=1 Tax=Bacillus sp. 7884-1 TaxID=2021693 RepID=UPI00211D0A26
RLSESIFGYQVGTKFPLGEIARNDMIESTIFFTKGEAENEGITFQHPHENYCRLCIHFGLLSRLLVDRLESDVGYAGRGRFRLAA